MTLEELEAGKSAVIETVGGEGHLRLQATKIPARLHCSINSQEQAKESEIFRALQLTAKTELYAGILTHSLQICREYTQCRLTAGRK